jgi:hypothetical protein
VAVEAGFIAWPDLTRGETTWGRHRAGCRPDGVIADGDRASAIAAASVPPGPQVLGTGLAIEDVRAKKGSAWALFFSGGRLSAADYYPAPHQPAPGPDQPCC